MGNKEIHLRSIFKNPPQFAPGPPSLPATRFWFRQCGRWVEAWKLDVWYRRSHTRRVVVAWESSLRLLHLLHVRKPHRAQPAACWEVDIPHPDVWTNCDWQRSEHVQLPTPLRRGRSCPALGLHLHDVRVDLPRIAPQKGSCSILFPAHPHMNLLRPQWSSTSTTSHRYLHIWTN